MTETSHGGGQLVKVLKYWSWDQDISVQALIWAETISSLLLKYQGGGLKI